ncbi:hypothetical protein [Streptomyces sp. NPDC001292]|uniref:hypothetical protein n=1 Tax=Streptomyces sp. NPDC001292 TaxID=3364558 RepID=UPI0036A47D25
MPGHLPAVRHNLERLEDVLRRGGIFGGREETGGQKVTGGREDAGGQDVGGQDEITVLRSPSLDEFSEALRTAAQEAEGLLLCYFAGHGAVPSAGDELFLQMRNARVVAGGRAVFPGADAFTGVLTVLAGSHAERIVVILDCCYAGNAAKVWHDFADRRQRILLLMSVQANRLIDSGDGTRATPFTVARLLVLPLLAAAACTGGGPRDGQTPIAVGVAHRREHRPHAPRRGRPSRLRPRHPAARPPAGGLPSAHPALRRVHPDLHRSAGCPVHRRPAQRPGAGRPVGRGTAPRAARLSASATGAPTRVAGAVTGKVCREARGVRCRGHLPRPSGSGGASQGGASPAYWTYSPAYWTCSGDATTRRGAVPDVASR